MAFFTDTKGDRWEVPFTLRQVLRVKELLGIDLAQIAGNKDPRADFDALKGDLARMVDVLFVCCEAQARERGVSDAEFAGRLDLGAFGDALEAFTRGFVDFFLTGPAKARAQKTLDERARLLTRRVEREQERVLASLESFASASSSPDTAGSSPSHGPSASSPG